MYQSQELENLDFSFEVLFYVCKLFDKDRYFQIIINSAYSLGDNNMNLTQLLIQIIYLPNSPNEMGLVIKVIYIFINFTPMSTVETSQRFYIDRACWFT